MPVEVTAAFRRRELDFFFNHLVVPNRRLLLVRLLTRSVRLTRAVRLALLDLLEHVRGPYCTRAVHVRLVLIELLVEHGRFPRRHVIRVGPEDGFPVDHDHPRLRLTSRTPRPRAECFLEDFRWDLLQGLLVDRSR